MTAMAIDPDLCIELPAGFDDSDSESQVHPIARKMFFGRTNAEVFGKAQLWASEQNVHLIDAAWDEEIDSRIEDIVTGKVELVDGEETRRMVRAELAARRNA